MTQTTTQIVTLEFIIPYTKEEITDNARKESTYKEFVSQILRCLPREQLKSVTCIKSFVTKHENNDKKLETVKIIGPNSLEKEFKFIISEGILYRNRKTYPFHNSDASSKLFPKRFTLKMRNVPHFLPDEQITAACNLQKSKISKLRHQVEKINDDLEIFNGICYADIEVQDQTKLDDLISWNQKAFTSKFMIEEMPFKCAIQSLLVCDFCKKEELSYMGHHVRQCRLKKIKPKQVDEGADDRVDSLADGEEAAASTKEPESKIPKVIPKTNPVVVGGYYLDVNTYTILDAQSMNERHRGILDLAQNGKDIDVLNHKKTVTNQLLHVKKIEDQTLKEFFKDQYLKDRIKGRTIYDFDFFRKQREGMDLYHYEKEPTFYLVNREGKVQNLFDPCKKMTQHKTKWT